LTDINFADNKCSYAQNLDFFVLSLLSDHHDERLCDHSSLTNDKFFLVKFSCIYSSQ